MEELLTRQEVTARIERFYQNLNRQGKDWDAVFIVDKINHYYFTGTMQDGLFVLKKDGSYAYFVRRSYERAKREGLIDSIYPMTSYRDVLNFANAHIHTLYIDANVATLAHLQRLQRHFQIDNFRSVDSALQYTRSIKSEYELALIRESGRQHRELMESIVPSLLEEGMNEADLTGRIYEKMVALGYHGVSRFAMFQTEIVAGQIGFGDNAVYPTSFDGPGGMKGMSPAVPIVGERERRLKKGDLVFVDIGYGYKGYHSDRTQIYMFGAKPSEEAAALHNRCRSIQKQAAALLRPGNVPSEIYTSVVGGLDSDFKENFMGLGDAKVKFLGHGVGLQIDEYPVIAEGFRTPLEKNMVIALEPKKSIENVGIVGVEDTYIVTEKGGECITGGEKEIMVV